MTDRGAAQQTAARSRSRRLPTVLLAVEHPRNHPGQPAPGTVTAVGPGQQQLHVGAARSHTLVQVLRLAAGLREANLVEIVANTERAAKQARRRLRQAWRLADSPLAPQVRELLNPERITP